MKRENLQDADILMTRAEAADYLRRATSTLERWAKAGEGPTFRKVGGRTLYPLIELRRFAGVEINNDGTDTAAGAAA